MLRTNYTFYFLHESHNEDVGYVGMTTDTIQARLRRHLYEAQGREHSPNSEKNIWIRSLLDQGKQPRCQVLEVSAFKDPQQAGAREQFWIKKYREEGKDLKNMTCLLYTSPSPRD